jgi:hypothetical protein
MCKFNEIRKTSLTHENLGRNQQIRCWAPQEAYIGVWKKPLRDPRTAENDHAHD